MASMAYATRFLRILTILMKAVASTSTHCKKESGWVNEDSVNTCSFSLPQSYIQFLGSERMLQWLSIGSGMLCGYTASWGNAWWPNGCQAFQVRLCQGRHLAFTAGQHVHVPVVFEQGWSGTWVQKQSHRAQGFSFYHVKKEELKVWEQERCESKAAAIASLFCFRKRTVQHISSNPTIWSLDTAGTWLQPIIPLMWQGLVQNVPLEVRQNLQADILHKLFSVLGGNPGWNLW